MSNSRLSLKSPPVIAAVVILGIAVTVLNIRTFGSKSPRRKPAPALARVQEYPAIPADLGRVVQQALQQEALPARSGTRQSPARVERDPFQRTGHAVHATAVAIPLAEGEADSLRCAAVLLGGKRPVALIDGEACTLGSWVRGMTIENIEYDGVSLRTSDGDLRFLPLITDQTTERNRP